MLQIKINEISVGQPLKSKLEMDYLKLFILPLNQARGMRFTADTVKELKNLLAEFSIDGTMAIYNREPDMLREMLTDKTSPLFIGKSFIWEQYQIPTIKQLVDHNYVQANLEHLLPDQTWTPMMLRNETDAGKSSQTYTGYDLGALANVLSVLGVALRAYQHGDEVRLAPVRKLARV